MLDLDRVDLDELSQALEDNSYDHSWWIDPRTGAIELWSEYSAEQGEEDPEERDLRHIEPIGSDEAYRDMEDFIARVPDPKARDLLERAIDGRGAFRRFKDTLLELPELREAWFAFHDTRMRRRALEWLARERLVDRETAMRAMPAELEPPTPTGAFDAFEIARAAAGDLRALYGSRLRRVVLFGSWARGDAHPESDIDLLVVLAEMASPWEELKRMDPILDRYSVEHGTVLSAVPVAETDLHRRGRPAIARALVEGRDVA